MKIFATKKALDYFSVDHESQKIDESFNQWAMMLKRVNRRNLLLLMHIPSRYLVIFFGFKKPKKDKHEPFIYNLMREFYESKSVNTSVIDDLLKPGQLSFHPSASKKVLGHLNIKFSDLEAWSHDFDYENILQSELIEEMNWYEGIHYQQKKEDSFFVLLEKEYPHLYSETPALELSTKLLLDNYRVERNFHVHPNMSLHDFHRLLQIGYQYSDSYIHSFYTLDEQGDILDEISNLFEFNDEILATTRGNENHTTLTDVFSEVNSLLYVYNFEAEWQILITPIKRKLMVDKRLPYCSQSFSEAPHESLGSEEDYDFYLEFVQHMIHPLFRSYFEADGTFDQQAINQLIEKEMYR